MKNSVWNRFSRIIFGVMLTAFTGWGAVFSITNPSVNIGESGIGITPTLTFYVHATGTAASPCTKNTTYKVDWNSADATAMAGEDYTAKAGTLSFTQPNYGVTNGICWIGTMTVSVNGDATHEKDETFSVNLTNPSSGALIETAQGIGKILNDDLLYARISSPTPNVLEENAGSTTYASYTVSLNGIPDSNVSVNYGTRDGTALAGYDYTPTSGSFNFSAGTTDLERTITVPILGDNTYEGDEYFHVDLLNPSSSNASYPLYLGVPSYQTTTITENDPERPDLIIVQDSSGNVAVNENMEYILNVKNQGTKKGQNVTLTIDLPSGLNNVTPYLSPWWNCSSNALKMTCTYNFELYPYVTSLPLRIRAKAASAGTYTILSTVSTTTAESYTNNNDAITSIVVTDTAYNYYVEKPRPYTMVEGFPYNMKGNMQLIGNSVMWDSKYNGQCAPERVENNLITSKWIDLDSDPKTYNSTSAQLKLPKGVDSSKIKYAGLYWQGRTIVASDMKYGLTALIKPQGYSNYQVVTSIPSKSDWTYGVGYQYQSVADITDVIKSSINTASSTEINTQGYSGTLWVGNVYADQIANGYGAWSLVIVYKDDNENFKNIAVYDGFEQIFVEDKSVTLDGFRTPYSGKVNSQFFVFAGEGDITKSDGVSLSNKANTDIRLWNPDGTEKTDNIFQSSETINGTNVTSRSPSCKNTVGVDIHTFDVGVNGSTLTPQIIGNNQTQTTIKLISRAMNLMPDDEYFPGVFAFATDAMPEICYMENVFKGTTNISGSGVKINKGDQLTFRVYLKNIGDEIAEHSRILHPFNSTSLPYVAGSANYTNGAPAYDTLMPPTSYTPTSATDGADNDLFSYDSSTATASIHVGTNATGSNGGILYPYPTSSPVFEYSATIETTDVNFTNTYKAAFKNTGLGIDYTDNPITIGTCDGSKNSFYAAVIPDLVFTGNVDIVDGYSGSGESYRSWITTKVSNKSPYTLKAVYLGNSNTSVPQPYTANGNASITVLLKLADMSNTAMCEEAPTVNLYTTAGGTTPVVATLNPNDTNVSTNPFTMAYVSSGTTPLAKQNVRIKYKAVDFNKLITDSGIQCANRNSTGGAAEGIPSCLIGQENDSAVTGNYKTIFGDTGYERCYVNNGKPCIASHHGVGSAPYNSAYGCYECSLKEIPYQCSNDNFAIRPNRLDIQSADVDMPNLLRSAQEYNTTVRAYNYGTTDTSSDYNVTSTHTAYTLVTTKYNKNNTVTPSMAGVLSSTNDFNMTNGISTLSEIGSNEVAAIEFDDIGKINISLQDRTWALVDITNNIDPTERNCNADGAYVCGDQNVTFIPDHFDFDTLSITNNNGNPGSFTYLANEVANMAARINTKIRALNKANVVTQNFSTYPLYENNVTIVPVVRKATYKYPDANESNITNLPIGFVGGNRTITWNEINTSRQLRFNFKRDYNQTANAFDVTGADLNVSITSLYTDPSDGNTATIKGSRNATATGNSTFVYGRFVPRNVRIFGSVPFSVNGWYEVYGTPTLSGTSLTPSKNGTLWFTNQFHNEINDGDANVTLRITAGALDATKISGNALNGIETYNFNAVGAGNIPYSTRAHIDTAPWLWYGTNASPYQDPTNPANLNCQTHPCFNINVVFPIAGTGSAKEGNSLFKDNKKTTTGGGGGAWRSTSDYAPAIR